MRGIVTEYRRIRVELEAGGWVEVTLDVDWSKLSQADRKFIGDVARLCDLSVEAERESIFFVRRTELPV
jgi:hypothetical protein